MQAGFTGCFEVFQQPDTLIQVTDAQACVQVALHPLINSPDAISSTLVVNFMALCLP